MKLFKKLLLGFLWIAVPAHLYSQDFSNKGKDFWIGYGNHVRMFNNSPWPQTACIGGVCPEKMQLYITSDVNTSGNVDIPGVGFSQSFSVSANQITTIDIPRSAALNDEGLFNRGIHVTALKPIVVYSFIYVNAVSGATVCLPTNTLGREYYSVNFKQLSNEPNSHSYFFVVAADTGTTTVEITPTALTKNGSAANVPFIVTLTQGQVYQVLGQTASSQGVDLTGSRIRSLNMGSGCKRIAVFCGSGKISIGCNDPSVGSSDNLYQQIYPTGVWGKTYITVPPTTNGGNSLTTYYRIIRPDPLAIVTLNGAILPGASFTNGFYYQFTSNTTNVISSNLPILVAQYFTTSGGTNATNCSNPANISDPEMIYLNPVEQTVTDVTLNSMQPSVNTNITTHFLNVVLRNVPGAINSLRIDGVSYPASFSPVPQDMNYAFARLSVPSQGHRVTCDSAFNIIAYGMGSAESYGYSGGTNLKDLYQFVSIVNQYATVNFPATCKNAPFNFRIVFPYQPTQIQWVFGAALNAMGIADVTITNPVYDSTWIVNGRQVYRYSLPLQYNIATVGTYPIKVIANNPTPDGCSGVQEIDYDLQVFDPPGANFNFATNGCVTSPVTFTDVSNTGGRPVIQWNWNFGDAGTSNIQNPSHTYTAPGSYLASLSVITDVGCISDTMTKQIDLTQSPQARFGASLPRCVGKPVTFTDSSTVTGGNSLAKWYWNFGDGSPQVIATSNAPQIHTYTSAGTYTATLKVETTSGCMSVVFSRQIVINANPLASFSLNGSVCLPQGAATFVNGSTISDGTGPLMTYLWNFGDGNTSTASSPVHNFTTGGPFTVTLTATSNNGCIDDTVRTISTIYAQPDAAFTVDSMESCHGGTFNFTDQSTAANSTINQWFWDFGDATTSNIQNPAKQYATPGTYTVKLYINSAAGCRSDTATMNVTVLQLPTVSFTNSGTVCEGVAVQLTSTSVSNGGTISQYNWTVNGSPVGGNNPVVSYTPTVSGNNNIVLSVTTNKGCSNQASGTLPINPRPVASFNLPNICLPAGNATFTSTSTVSGGSITSYLWNFGNSQTATTATASTTYSNTGPYNVSLTVTSSNGCVDDSVRALNTIFAQPQASFGAPVEVCLGAPVNFADQSTAPNSAVTQWLWNFGDATTSTAQHPIKNYTTPGTYTVTLTITSGVGCISSTATRTVVVNPLPAANFTTSTPACEGRNITFTDASAANAGNLTKWTWNFGDGNTAVMTNPNPFVHSYANAGTFNVTLQVETNKGCISTVLTKPVIVNILPAAGFISPEICLTDPGAPFIDTSRIATGNIATWQWNFGDPNATAVNPNSSTLQNPVHQYSVVGNYTATLIVASNNGCTDTIAQTFTVNGSIPLANFTIQNANALCSNKDVVIADASTVDFGNLIKTEIYWDWTNDPTIKTTDNSPSLGKLYGHTYPEFGSPGTRTITVRMVTYSGITCMNVMTKTITLLATPALRFDPVNEICSNAPSFQITQADITNGLPGAGVFSGPGVSNTGLFNPTTAGAGSHTIRYTFTAANGCSNFIEQTIRVNPTPNTNAGPDKVVLEGGQVQLTPAMNAGFPVTYTWTPPAGLSNANAPDPMASPADDITYTLKITSDKGCTTSDQVFVKVLKKPAIPNIFSPNGDNIHDKWVIGFLDTYPGCTVEIFNRYGQRIYFSVGYSTPWDGTINGKPVPVGTYYYIVDPKNGRQKMTGYIDIVR